MTRKTSASVITAIGILMVLALIFAFCTLGHAATSSTQRHPNSLGTVSYDTNPLIYIPGNVKQADWVDGNLNLRFLPLGTYALYDQQILLCAPADKFSGVTEPFMLVYERQSHKSVQGVGCHELRAVYGLVKKEETDTWLTRPRVKRDL